MRRKQLNLIVCVVLLALTILSGCKKHEHTYGEWSVSANATCTAEGIEIRACECGDTQTRSIAASAHSFGNWTTTLNATCQNVGENICVCTTCNAIKTVEIAKTGHKYDSGKTTTEATCQNTGVKTYTCTTCLITKTETIAKSEHEYGSGEITTEATCQNVGVRTYTCRTCNTAKTMEIAKTSHKYDNGEITTEATCQSDGVKTYTCTTCNAIKTETIAKLGHNPNSKNICTRCGIDCPIELNMTDSEIASAKKIEWIAERKITNLQDEQQFRLMFSLKDKDENWLKVPMIVAIKITNDNGELVYKATKAVKTSDYSGWTNGYGKEWTAAAIYIPYADITRGTTDKGTVSFEVYNDYVSFNTSTLTISEGLPVKPSKIIIPNLPAHVSAYSYSGSVISSVNITSISYEISGDDLYIYFTGEKTYDKDGNNYSRTCKVGWKVYDSENYIVASGTFYSPNVAVGEKFRNERADVWNVIKPGETYRIEISSVD